MHALPDDPIGFLLAHPSLASVGGVKSPSGAAPRAGESLEAGRKRVLGVLEPQISAAVGLVLDERPADPTAVVVRHLLKQRQQ